jgi:hypothetical protein
MAYTAFGAGAVICHEARSAARDGERLRIDASTAKTDEAELEPPLSWSSWQKNDDRNVL